MTRGAVCGVLQIVNPDGAHLFDSNIPSLKDGIGRIVLSPCPEGAGEVEM
jgi:hypothetical protein